MAVIASWVDYLPENRTHERDLLSAAVAKAQKDVAEIERDQLPPKAVANRLAMAAAEAVRITCLLRRDGMAVALPYVGVFHRALPSLEKLTDPYGILAFANVMLAHGVAIDGWHDAITTGGLEREVAVLEEQARIARLSRVLGFAALGTGRGDLVRKLSNDPVLHGLADACENRDADPFFAFVSDFPASDVGYAELLFVARAFVVVLLESGSSGIRTAAQWLHSTVHEGPKPLAPKRVPLPPDVPRMNEGAKVKTGPSAFPWTSIEFSDRHGLWGGCSIAVSSIGDYELIDTGVHRRARRFRTTLEPDALAELDALIAKHPPRSNEPRPLPPLALPDSVSESLVLTIDGREVFLSDATAPEAASFHAIKHWMMKVAAPPSQE
jgi:hypothetical protein